MSLLDKCATYTRRDELREVGLYPYYTPFEGHGRPVALLDGAEYLMCGSNSYLGLSTDPRVQEAARTAIDAYGTSFNGSRLLNGNSKLMEELEAELADYFGKPAALVVGTGYQTNLAAVGTLLHRGIGDPKRIVLVDKQVHASLIDGIRLSRSSDAALRWFRHNDAEDLDRKLAECPADTETLVIVDGVYSMEGDICDLPAIVEVCRRYDTTLLVDDAHGASVLAEGRGTAAHFGLADDVDVLTISFGKGLGSCGGVVLGSEILIQYLRNHARGVIFSSGLGPADAAAVLQTVRIMREEIWRPKRVLEIAEEIRSSLTALGYDVGPSASPIVPVMMPDDATVFTAWRKLMDLGVYTNAVIGPAASPRLRTSWTATHTPEHVQQAIAAFAAIRDEVLPR
ncbi:pyridoxal phosphate-dependent aminotransferase family protein [Streptomyces sp. NPDC046909]|uniref:aminotransferase class I/II-fold pyridoxal phosphate-dependent enzyme n=1 Tax=Streptomyces sp. NPDC046909 TaxID=3155617 RepID=UPI0033E91B6B